MEKMEKIEKGLHELIIDKEIVSVFPPRTSKDEETLIMQLRTEGCRDDLITWHGIIIDGHTRYRVCHEYNIPFSYREMSFPSKERAKLWMIENQVARRNLSVFQRCVIALPFERAYKEEAEKRRREKISEYRKTGEMPQNSAVSKETRDALADLVGTSHDTIDKVKYILKNGSDELKEEVSRGNISIHKAFTSLKPKKDSQEKAGVKSNELVDVNDAAAVSDASEASDTEEEFDGCDMADMADNAEVLDDEIEFTHGEYERSSDASSNAPNDFQTLNASNDSDAADDCEDWLPRACSTDGEDIQEPEIEHIAGFKPVTHQEPFEYFPHEPERNPGPFYYVKDYTRSALKNMLKEITDAVYQLSDEDAEKGYEILSMLDEAYNEARKIIEGEIEFHSHHK